MSDEQGRASGQRLSSDGVEDGRHDRQDEQDEGCDAQRDSFLCSRPNGHDGDHAAFGFADTPYRRWAE